MSQNAGAYLLGYEYLAPKPVGANLVHARMTSSVFSLCHAPFQVRRIYVDQIINGLKTFDARLYTFDARGDRLHAGQPGEHVMFQCGTTYVVCRILSFHKCHGTSDLTSKINFRKLMPSVTSRTECCRTYVSLWPDASHTSIYIAFGIEPVQYREKDAETFLWVGPVCKWLRVVITLVLFSCFLFIIMLMVQWWMVYVR